MTYIIIAALLVTAELIYFRVAEKYNIIDKPNQRSSHTSIVLRGGGIIFLVGVWIWAGVSFIDDIRSLPDSVRLVAQFMAMGLLIFQLFRSSKGLGMFSDSNLLINIAFVAAALIVCVGATNIINFMDGINGITAGYSLAVLVPFAIVNCGDKYVEQSIVITTIIAALVFCIFNFRPKGKAKCFAGDIGSIGIAFIMLFLLGSVIVRTGDVTWLIFLLVYGVDGCLTIMLRIMLHENLGEAHRKHAYPVPGQRDSSLALPHRCTRGASHSVCTVHKKVLPSA